MPDRSWKVKNRGEKWQKGETFNTVIGQGFILSTPLQLSLMTARIATGKKIIPSILFKKRQFEDLNINKKNLSLFLFLGVIFFSLGLIDFCLNNFYERNITDFLPSFVSFFTPN